MELTRWPHQSRAFAETVSAIEMGEQSILVTSPTGGGKSLMMIDLIRWALDRGWRVVLYTNRKMLLDQLSGVLSKHGIAHGLRASEYDASLLDEVQISSIQTELARVYKSQKWDLHFAKLVIIDEAHNNCGDTAKRIIADHRAKGAVIVGYTATPLGLADIYSRLIVAGKPSELRECGALVTCNTYGPDEPDTKAIKKLPSGEFSENDVRKVFNIQQVFGRILDWWKRLNPDARPTILFAPGVKESVWCAQQFEAMGVRAAHIDGEDIYLDGKLYDSDRRARDELLEQIRDGSVKVVCNRFVLREGIDLPELYHGILATVFGGLQSYLQSGGRLLRAHPSLDHVCVSRDTPVLTDMGLVKIQDVTTSDLVWDGIEFVSHDGPSCMGHREVIEWDGLIATPEHKVHTNHGWKTIASAARERERLTRSGIDWKPIRVLDDSDPYNEEVERVSTGSRGALQVWEEVVQEISQDRKASSAWLPTLLAQIWGPLPGMDLPSCTTSVAAVQRQEGNHVPPLWWAWHQIQVCLGIRWGMLDCCQSWSAERPHSLAGPHQQRWQLRAWESSLGELFSANEEPRQNHQKEFSLSSILGGIPGRWLRAHVSGLSLPRGSYREPDRRTVAETWDIVNAGPRHRFTAAGALVGNCLQDHGGNWHRHGSLNADREWELDYTNNIVTGLREQAMRDKKQIEPIVCPNCGRVRSAGKQCPECLHEAPKKTRIIVQTDGTLKEMQGDIYRPRRVKRYLGIADDWKRMYYRGKARCKKGENCTFVALEALFARENDWSFPPRDLPLMPREPADWFRAVDSVPRERLIGDVG